MEFPMNRIVIDTDPGVDDAHAILLASAHPLTTIEALTVVAGNVSLEKAVRNAGIIVEVTGKKIPVYAGCEDGLVIPTPRRALSHGLDGLGDSGYPNPSIEVSSEHAANTLVRLANESPGELTLVAIGPLTNIALATCLDPNLPQKYRRLVVMGGAIHAVGNSWDRAAEFNFYCDPEAASIVLRRWPGLTLVPWETALANGLSPSQVKELSEEGSPRAVFFRKTLKNRFIEQSLGMQVLSVPDPLALAVAIEPDLVQRSESRYIEIELAGQMTRGQTVVDWYNLTGKPANVNIVYEVNQNRFWELMKKGFQ